DAGAALHAVRDQDAGGVQVIGSGELQGSRVNLDGVGHCLVLFCWAGGGCGGGDEVGEVHIDGGSGGDDVIHRQAGGERVQPVGDGEVEELRPLALLGGVGQGGGGEG